jgi:hypothetical protein
MVKFASLVKYLFDFGFFGIISLLCSGELSDIALQLAGYQI